ncbi:MAG: hypothetical protein U0168_16530 [Nannocystaceae bacterium]
MAVSTRGSLPRASEQASALMPMPGAIALLRYSGAGETTSKVVAVPKSTTMTPPPGSTWCSWPRPR